MVELQFRPGEVIFSPGDPSTHAFLIQAGSVEILTGPEEHLTRLALLRPGDVFGEMGLIEERTRSATARAVNTVKAAKLTREEFEHDLLHDPARCSQYLRGLFERLRSLTARLEGQAEAAAHPPSTETGLVPRTARLTLYPLTRKAAQCLPENGLVLPELPFRIGRASEANEPQSLDLNDLWLLDQEPFSVSRNHLVIEQVHGKYLIRDRGSKAGTYVNDQRIGGSSPIWYAELEEGDNVFTVGTRMSPYQFRLNLVK
jgi:hypothetical protein